MARQFEILTPYFVGWDTNPGLPYPITWVADFPPVYQNPEAVLLIQGVAVVGTPALVGARRVILSFQGPGPDFQDWLIVPSTGTLAAVGGGARRFEFQVGHQVGTTGNLFKEVLPAGLVLLPGHRLVISFENPQAGDVMGFAALRGTILSR